MTKPAITIHGGFFSELTTSPETKLAKQEALRFIIRKSWDFLQTHSALQTAIYACTLLEDDPLFNAGTGSQIQSDGVIRMSASICDGETQKFSGVINLEDVKNPVLVAEKLLDCEDRILAGEGALRFARSHGFGYYDPRIPIRIQDYEAKKKAATKTGTIGCVALDSDGRLAAATSTGGKGFEIVGRVSDSATVAGNYANQFCGVSCTGVGEDIVNGAVAAKIVTRVTDGMPLREAVEKTFTELKPFDGFAGIVAIDHFGNMIQKDSHPHIVYALKNDGSEEIFG